MTTNPTTNASVAGDLRRLRDEIIVRNVND
jgi:hypothetical protein